METKRKELVNANFKSVLSVVVVLRFNTVGQAHAFHNEMMTDWKVMGQQALLSNMTMGTSHMVVVVHSSRS